MLVENIGITAIITTIVIFSVEFIETLVKSDPFDGSGERMSVKNRSTIFGKTALILFRSVEGLWAISLLGWVVNVFWLGVTKLTGINIDTTIATLLTVGGVAVAIAGVLLCPKFQNKISKKEAEAEDIKSALKKLTEIVAKKQSQQEDQLSRLKEICERLEEKLQTPVSVSVKLLKK